jgi:Flp pilus assembly pilin Flp
MKELVSFMRAFWRDESGQDMAEYVMLLVVVAIVVVSTALLVFGQAIANAFGRATTVIDAS